mgnify:FL=1
MITLTQPRFCLACSKQVRGRSDKKFCDDLCRNHYNNRLKAAGNNTVRNINHALAKNRRILESMIAEGEEMARTSKEALLQQGFRFRYFTHRQTGKNGTRYSFCYDYGYLPLGDDEYLLVREAAEP